MTPLLAALLLAPVYPALKADLHPVYGVWTAEGSTTIEGSGLSVAPGQTVWVPGAAADGADLYTVCVSAKQGAAVLKAAASATIHGVNGSAGTDNTPILQKVVDALAAKGGGTVAIPAGSYLVNGLTRRPWVKIEGEGEAVLAGNGSTDYVIDSPPGLHDSALVDLSIVGPGAGPKQGGIRCRGIGSGNDRNRIEDVRIRWCGERALYADASCIEDRYDDILVLNCGLNHQGGESSPWGYVELSGTDHYLSRVGVYGGQGGLTKSGNLVGVLLRSSNCWIRECTAEQCDVGLYDMGWLNRWSTSRSLLNFGLGAVQGAGDWSGASIQANGVSSPLLKPLP